MKLARWCFGVMGVAALLSVSAANAHLIVAQRGTLNVVPGGAYLALSLPVSAFKDVDDDGDGLLSVAELRKHATAIELQVRAGVELTDTQKAYPLDGLMLNAIPTDLTPTAPAPQIAVLGRFAVQPDTEGLRLSLHLFGTKPDEQAELIHVTRGSQSQLLTLTPRSPQQEVLPSAWGIFIHQIWQGMDHVLTGWDHLLFLLVVISAGWGFRNLLLALTCFTAGHAVSLTSSVLLGLETSSAWIEPAIAATLVGTVCFDRWSLAREKKPEAWVRLTLIFGCALIHGLGLAGALTALGIDPAHKVTTLIGFNLGIEIGQVLVAVVATLLFRFSATVMGSGWTSMSLRAASYAAVAIGIYWFFDRLPTGIQLLTYPT